jgi:uroporphyrinogen III methyltransferase/synthase
MLTLVTRPESQSHDFVAALAACGVEAVCVPTIAIGPPDSWDACDLALEQLDHYDALVFTSANGVRAFIERMAFRGHNCDELPAGFGLGRRTKEVMIDCGITVVPTDDALNASALASEICTFMTQSGYDGVEAMRFLFPCGDKARVELPETLISHGAIIDQVVVYSNRTADPAGAERVQQLFDNGEISVVTFFSPSAVDGFITLFPAFKDLHRARVKLAAIGETTAASIRAHGNRTSSPQHLMQRPLLLM